MDVHKNSIVVAMLFSGRETEVWKVANESRARRRLVRKLQRDGGADVRTCYEAGPMGYGLQRELHAAGVHCEVVAPSLIPKKPGERIKTDRRDARKLAEMLRANLLTEVQPPTQEEEAVRDLCRCREDAQEDKLRCRHRLGKFLLRRHLIYSRSAWTDDHRRWLRGIVLDLEADRLIFASYLAALEVTEERVKSLEEHIARIALSAPYAERVGWLRCFRGIDTLTAITILVELHHFGRFQKPRALMSYLGLVPSENSSGDRTRRGPITKTGNMHARRVLTEAAWHYLHRPGVSARLQKRRKGQPENIISIADCAQIRLHRKYWRMVHQGKPTQKAVTAVARELVGFIWAVLICELSRAPQTKALTAVCA
jgi:transposase